MDVLGIQAAIDRITAKAIKVGGMLGGIKRTLPGPLLISNEGLQFLEAFTSYSNLTTRFQDCLGKLEIGRSGQVLVWKDEFADVFAGFEKERDALLKKLEDYEARGCGA